MRQLESPGVSARTTAARWWQRLRATRPESQRIAAVDGNALDTFARSIDVTTLDEQQFVRLLETLHMLGTTGSGLHLRDLSTDVLADIVRTASKEQLRAVVLHGELRSLFLDEIFHRMSERFLPAKAHGADLVVSWRFTEGAGDGGYDRFQTVIEQGSCVSGVDLGREPDTTVTLCASDFIRMATGNANVASMFVTGKVRVKGEYAPAVRFSSYFDIPKPG